MSSIFSKIISGEIPSFKIAEDDNFLAFLDVFPLAKGHVLVIPKNEVDKFYEIDDILLAKWLVFAKPIAKAIEKSFQCKRVGLSIIGIEVPHAHLHLVPISTADDINFAKEKMTVSHEELKEIQQIILSNLHPSL
jgi:histidine triad (HIT) family protein